MVLEFHEVPTGKDLDDLFEHSSEKMFAQAQPMQDVEAHYDVYHHKQSKQGPYPPQELDLAEPEPVSVRVPISKRLKHALRFELFDLLVSDRRQDAKQLRPTAYVDGLRGYAALAVLLWHYFLPYYPLLANGYGLTGKESFLQLPILRTPISAGKSSVCFAM